MNLFSTPPLNLSYLLLQLDKERIHIKFMSLFSLLDRDGKYTTFNQSFINYKKYEENLRNQIRRFDNINIIPVNRLDECRVFDNVDVRKIPSRRKYKKVEYINEKSINGICYFCNGRF